MLHTSSTTVAATTDRNSSGADSELELLLQLPPLSSPLSPSHRLPVEKEILGEEIYELQMESAEEAAEQRLRLTRFDLQFPFPCNDGGGDGDVLYELGPSSAGCFLVHATPSMRRPCCGGCSGHCHRRRRSIGGSSVCSITRETGKRKRNGRQSTWRGRE